jgi:hypothetical protein
MTLAVGIGAATRSRPPSSVMINAGRASRSTWPSQSAGWCVSSTTNGRPAARHASTPSGNSGHAGSRTAIRSPGSVSAASVSASPETASHSSPKVRAVLASLIAMRFRYRRARRSRCSMIGRSRSWLRKRLKSRVAGPFQSSGRGSTLSHSKPRNVSRTPSDRSVRVWPSQGMQGSRVSRGRHVRRRQSTACSRAIGRACT